MPIDLTGSVQDPLAVQAILAHRAPAPPGPAPPAPVEVVLYRYVHEPASWRAARP
jgi:hypothetical protein